MSSECNCIKTNVVSALTVPQHSAVYPGRPVMSITILRLMMPMEMKRNRPLYLVLLVLSIVLGLLSRKFNSHFPEMVNDYLGDAIWAMMVYIGFAFILDNRKSHQIGCISLSFCYLIEISQLYQADWINAIRHTALGGLVLGFGFLWTDILAYTMGVGLAWCTEEICRRGLFSIYYLYLCKKLRLRINSDHLIRSRITFISYCFSI